MNLKQQWGFIKDGIVYIASNPPILTVETVKTNTTNITQIPEIDLDDEKFTKDTTWEITPGGKMMLLKECKRPCTTYLIGSTSDVSEGKSISINDDEIHLKVQDESLVTGGFLHICNKAEIVNTEVNNGDFLDSIMEVLIVEKFKGRIYLRAIVDNDFYNEPFRLHTGDFLYHSEPFQELIEDDKDVKFEIVFTDLNDNIIKVNTVIQEGEALSKSLKTALYFAKKNS